MSGRSSLLFARSAGNNLNVEGGVKDPAPACLVFKDLALERPARYRFSNSRFKTTRRELSTLDLPCYSHSGP